MTSIEWSRHIIALARMCDRFDGELGEGPGAVAIAMSAAMCVDDGVLDFARVTDATVLRYIKQAQCLCTANVRGYVECWRRYAERD